VCCLTENRLAGDFSELHNTPNESPRVAIAHPIANSEAPEVEHQALQCLHLTVTESTLDGAHHLSTVALFRHMCRYEQLERYALDHAEAQQQQQQQQHHEQQQQHHEQGSLGRHRPRPLALRHVLKAFVQDCRLSSSYFFADVKNMLALAKLLRHIEPHMGLPDMYTCCISPAGADDGPVVQVGAGSCLD
jgi:hypothetical protein